MASVSITVLATDPKDYAARIDRIKPFVRRLHVDVTDGVFAENKTVGLGQVYDIDGAKFDLHLMINHFNEQLETVLSLEPDLVIIHFEAEGDHAAFFEGLKDAGIKRGLAILPDTTIEQVKNLLPKLDHLLIFTGNLGYNGGEFKGECLDKIAQAKAVNADLELGVDGGINQTTARLAIDAGADLLNTGSFVHDAPDPEAAYVGLTAIAEGQMA